ncbi:MAG: radical SAM protein, partial [Candidatus Hadarchaeales archaeon]
EEVLRLATPDIHSVSLTGGEPLMAAELAGEVAKLCKKASLPVYLETNGSVPEAMKKIVKFIDYASIDVKLPEHKSVKPGEWESLFKKELSCVRIARKKAETFVKIVVLPNTKETTIFSVCKEIANLDVPVVIQPVTPVGEIKEFPRREFLLKLSEAAALAGVKDVAIIPQVHKFIGFR